MPPPSGPPTKASPGSACADLGTGRKALEGAAKRGLAAARTGAIVVLAATTGLGKTEILLTLVVLAAFAGNPVPVFFKDHALGDELVARATAIAQTLPGRPKGFEITKLEGTGRACTKHGARFFQYSQRSTHANHELCRLCDLRKTCKARAQWSKVGTKHRLILAPAPLAPRVLKEKVYRTAIFDELPPLFEIIRFSRDEIEAVANALFLPNQIAEFNLETQGWYDVRKFAADAALEIIDEEIRLDQKPYKQVIFGKDLLEEFDESDLRAAFNYEPTDGVHPSINAHHVEQGEKINPEFHVRADFDDIRTAVLAYLDGTQNLSTGVVGIFRDPDGSVGLEIIRSNPLLPDGMGALIFDAGAKLQELIIRAVFGNNVQFHEVAVAEPGVVDHLAVATTSFSRRHLSDESRRHAAFHKLMLDLCPYFVWWGDRHGKLSLTVGIASAKILHDDIKERRGPVGETLDLLEACGIVVTESGYYGALQGSDRFRDVDVWIRIGDEIPNLGDAAFLAHALRCEGVDIDPDNVVGITADYLDLQTLGRSRWVNRDAHSPLLDAKVGQRLVEYPLRLSGRGRSRSLESVIIEILGHACLDTVGWTSAPALRHMLGSLPFRMATGFEGFWDKALRGLLSSFNAKNPKTPGIIRFSNDQTRAALAKLKERRNLLEFSLPNRERTGRVHIYELPEHGNAYGLWLQSGQSFWPDKGDT